MKITSSLMVEISNMRWALTKFLLLWLLIAVGQIQGSYGCLENERKGLMEIKNFFGSRGGLFSWIDDRLDNCCAWKLVKCNPSTGHVTELSLQEFPVRQNWFLNVSLFHPFGQLRSLNLSHNLFDGLVEPEGFLSLKKLEILDLSYNQLDITALSNFSENSANLRKLEVLDLSSNLLRGPLLAEGEGLCGMKNLVELGLSSNMISQLPECLSNLTNLRVLDLTQNGFRGNVPFFISNLTSLEYLSLFGNFFEGSFSLSTLANHSKLEVLYFPYGSNRLQIETENPEWYPTFQLRSLILRNCNLNMNSGRTIPSFLQHQHELYFVDLSHNKMVGTFPSWLLQNNSRLGALILRNNSFEGSFQLFTSREGLSYLDISNNKISGMLPENIGIIAPSIMHMDLSANSFEGNIPSSLCQMKALWYLDMSNNKFSGELPTKLTTDCLSLEVLKLSNNFLQGQIIPKFSKWASIQMLYLNNNNFSGQIDEVIANNTSLYALDISNNSISGRIPSSIGQCSDLNILLMAENNLEGEIPNELSDLTNLEILDLSHNRLSGSVPYLPSVRFLYLQKNALSGSIPSTLTESSWVVTLDLSDNQFSGSIPGWIINLLKLRVLLLAGNHFQGLIPNQLCEMKNVSIMDLSRNKLNGSIPSCFTNLSFGAEGYKLDDDTDSFQMLKRIRWFLDVSPQYFCNATIKLDQPSIQGEIEAEVDVEVLFRTKSNYYSYKGSILELMTGLDLSCNELTGIIPPQVGELQNIRALNLSHNFLSGSIPNNFSGLTQIESLDLSYNNLSGAIPSQLSQLHFLAVFNVSYNNLSGMPPSIGQFANFDDNNYKGNPGLCGPLLKRSCEENLASPPASTEGGIQKETAVEMVSFWWSFATSYTTILLGLLIVLCINAQWRLTWFNSIDKIIHLCFPGLKSAH